MEEVVAVVEVGDHSEILYCNEEEDEVVAVRDSLKVQVLVSIVANRGTSSSTAVSINKKKEQPIEYQSRNITQTTETISHSTNNFLRKVSANIASTDKNRFTNTDSAHQIRDEEPPWKNTNNRNKAHQFGQARIARHKYRKT